jgi:predicted DNA-binding protein (UPF0251 family)
MFDNFNKTDPANSVVNSGTDYDYHLKFFPLNELEIMRNAQHFNVEVQGYQARSEFSYLKDKFLNIDEMGLTDKQLMAVSLVFYGGLKKKVAARIMKISSQALTDHINAGVKKMGNSFK